MIPLSSAFCIKWLSVLYSIKERHTLEEKDDLYIRFIRRKSNDRNTGAI